MSYNVGLDFDWLYLVTVGEIERVTERKLKVTADTMKLGKASDQR